MHFLWTRFRPRLVRLEDRTVPASFWDGGGDGFSWFDSANWAEDVLPTRFEAVFVSNSVTGNEVVFNPGAGVEATFDTLFFDDTINLRVASGTLHVEGSIDLGSLTVDPDATLTLEGSASYGSNSTLAGELLNQGTFQLGSAYGDFGSLRVTTVFRNEGTFLWDGSMSLRLGVSTSPGQVGFHNLGTTRIRTEEAVVGSFFPSGEFPPEVSFFDPAILNDGLIVQESSQTEWYDFASFENRGTIRVEMGEFFVFGDFTQSAGQLQLGGAEGSGRFKSSVFGPEESTVPGTVTLTGGSLVGFGEVSANIINDGGTIAPGFSPGGITITDDFTQTDAGRLLLEIAGLLPLLEHDQLIVGGAANLAGTLELVTSADFVPMVGDRFTLITAESIVGGFTLIVGPLPDRLFYSPFTDSGQFGVVVDRRPLPPEEPEPEPEPEPLGEAEPPDEPIEEEMPPAIMPILPTVPAEPMVTVPEAEPEPDFVVIPEVVQIIFTGTVAAVRDPERPFDMLIVPDGEASAAIRRLARRNEPFEYGTLYRTSGDATMQGEIAGTIWTDHDGDGKQDAAEPYRPGQVVFLDANDNGVRDDGEPWTITDAGGGYHFRDLWPGRYSVRLELGPKSEQTLPEEPMRAVVLTAEMRATDDADFAVVDRRLKRRVRPTPVSRPKPAPPVQGVVPGMGAIVMLTFLPTPREEGKRSA